MQPAVLTKRESTFEASRKSGSFVQKLLCMLTGLVRADLQKVAQFEYPKSLVCNS
jgi:hypothetical protein